MSSALDGHDRVVGGERIDGYAALRDYAAIGDGRTLALVARDGAIDWLCTPEFDSPSMFAALLDAGRGGATTLQPDVPFTVERCYVRDTNVLETTFTTADGVLRLTDALQLDLQGDAPCRTLLRRVECLAGRVALTWGAAPRFGYGEVAPVVEPAGDGATLAGAGQVARVHVYGLGDAQPDDDGVRGHVQLELGDRGLLALVIGDEPPGDGSRDAFEQGLDDTAAWWRDWSSGIAYDGPWRDALVRSCLALRLLVSSRTGAIVAAGTTSLPEVLGGLRNWDYRYSWVRDSLLVLDALFSVGRNDEATAYFQWLRARLDPHTGHVGVLYDLDGSSCAPERELPLPGWRGSRPVRVGNSAADQYQQSTYGTLLHACHLYAARAHGGLPREQQQVFLHAAARLAGIWHEPDDGIWEERGPAHHHTHSKMMSALGLHCAADLARKAGAGGGLAERLQHESAAAAAFVEQHCVDPETGAYVRSAGRGTFDASLLMPLGMGFGRWSPEGRVRRTIDVIRERLGGGGALLYRYREDDGLPGDEGFFTPCSFWLAGALAHCRRVDEAAAVLDELTGLANDAGIFSEELDADGAFLGNLPQALTHASLVSAVIALDDAIERRAATSSWSPR